MTSETTKKTTNAKAVYVIREGAERNYWTKIGAAFVNSDGSLNVVLDALPANGRLHIRDFREEA